MERPNYRVLLSYDSERKVFIARIPELPPCTGEGANRGEALANMERELDALLQNMNDGGGRVPPAIDEMPSSGEITIKVSRSLHRDLAFMAQVEDIELSQLASELLTSAVDHRQRSGRLQRRGPREGQPQREGQPAGASSPSDDQPPRRDNRDNRGGERGDYDGNRWRGGDRDRNTAARFHGLLEDRASFMEYVRGLEADGGHGRGPRGNYGPGGHGGHGGGGGGYDRGGGGGGRRPGPERGPRSDRPRGDRRPGGGGGDGGQGGQGGGPPSGNG